MDKLFKRIYEDNVSDRLTDARFTMLSEDYEQEQDELLRKIERLEQDIAAQEEQTDGIDRFIRKARKYINLEKLTPAILNDLVKAVYIHAPDKSSGHRVQEVEISYDLIGILPASLLLEIQNGKTA